MNFKTLLEIADTYLDYNNINFLPADSYTIATQQLNIRVKNSLECKTDYKTENNPLKYNDAIYAIFKGEYTIYHDENHPYKNFFIAHEIAHHLLDHRSDDINKHHDTNLLAAIIVAPPHLIKKYKIHSSIQLAEQCKIPIEVAETYWKEYKVFRKQGKNNALKIAVLWLFGGFLALSLAIIPFQANKLKMAENTATTNELTTTTETTTSEITTKTNTKIRTSDNPIVYITKYGEKFHQAGCYYIEGKDDIIELPESEAINLGYTPCKICMH